MNKILGNQRVDQCVGCSIARPQPVPGEAFQLGSGLFGGASAGMVVGQDDDLDARQCQLFETEA